MIDAHMTFGFSEEQRQMILGWRAPGVAPTAML